MKIKLKVDLPIPEEHGAKSGRVFEVIREEERKYYFIGDDGKECAAFNAEVEFVNQ